MPDHPGRPHPPAFSWNAGMVIHVLKSDPVLQELEHVQVDGLVLLTCFSMTSRAVGVWSRMLQMLSKPTWRRPFLEWISCSAHFNISLLPLMEAWQWSVAASDHRRLRSWAKNPAHNAPVGEAWESDSSSQLVGSAPQQDGRTSGMGKRTEARLATHTGAARLCGRPPKSQCTTVSRGGSPPSSPDRGAPDSDGYSTVSETVGCRHRCRCCRGSRERKWLAPVRLDMPIFKWTDPGAEVTYMLWCFNVDAFLEQYDEASSVPPYLRQSPWVPG